jgi:hypothetical protein
MSRERNSRSSLKRRPPVREGNIFLVVTEGEKTEPKYFDALKRRLRLPSVQIEIFHPPSTDPIGLVDCAITMRNNRNRQNRDPKYDEVWVVFDLEKTHDERRELAGRAINRARDNKIRIAYSDPCFEFWLLLHEEYTTRSFDDCADVVKSLRKYHPNYEKGSFDHTFVLEKTPTAVSSAAKVREYHVANGTKGNPASTEGNPSTRVDHLVRKLNEAAQPSRQFHFS